ncbi:MAG: HAD-IB family phosphatase [Minisyncoccia bacterium]
MNPILVFDFDSTIASVESLEVLAEYALRNNSEKEDILKKMKEITNLGMDGTIPYEESLSRRMPLLSLTVSDVHAFAPTMTKYVTRSFSEHVDFFTQHADTIYVVSGGFDDLIFPVTDVLSIPRSHVFANNFVYDTEGRVVGVDTMRPASQKGGKAEQIRSLGLTGKIYMVGDGMTDYDVKRQGVASTFIAYTEHARREPVVAVADHEITDFAQLLKLL